MSATQNPTPGTDFWTGFGLGEGTSDRQDAVAPPTADRRATGTENSDLADPRSGPANEPELDLEITIRDVASPDSGGAGSPADAAEEQVKTPAVRNRTTGARTRTKSAAPHTPARPAASEPKDELKWPARLGPPPVSGPENDRSDAEVTRRAPEAPMSEAERAQTEDVVKPSATDWLCPPPAAEPPKEPADKAGLEIVLTGWPQFGQFWWDERVNEVHIRGTQVTVCGRLGVWRAPSLSSLDLARWAIEALTAVQEEAGAVVTHIADSVVVSRRQRTGPDPATLIAAGILTDEQLARVRTALERTRAVVLVGPAAPVVMRSFTALLPQGSRVFQAPYAALPAWCVAAASPLDADYVVGVCPGASVERMVAMGQIGALIANPETQFEAAVQLSVRGRSAAPEKLISGHPRR